MSNKITDSKNLFAFRTDDELADLLIGESNRSEIIVRALREYYHRHHAITCPTCKGQGFIYNPPEKRKSDANKRKRTVSGKEGTN